MTAIAPPLVGTFRADPVHSSFQFAVRHMNLALFTASFDDVDAQVVADTTGVRLSGAVRVESISIKTPPEFRQHVLYGAEFFDAANHPELTFGSDDVQLADDGTVALRGELTIKGISRPFTATGSYQAPVEDPYGAQRAAVELVATVDRRDWGMTWQAPLPKGGDVLGYEVMLTARVQLVQQG